MHEEQRDRWFDDAAARHYRPSDRAPLDEMWSEIEARTWHDSRRSWRGWRITRSPFLGGLAAAACLVIGFALGRQMAVNAPSTAANVPTAADSLADPYNRAATDLLGETVVLLRALPASRSEPGTQTTERFSAQATDLLVTTRLLLDSPAAADPRMHELLQDLELVLAQVARLPDGKSQDLDLITEALAERDIVPRIRRVAAELATGDN